MPTYYRDQVTILLQQTAGFGDPQVLDAEEIVISPHGEIDLDWLNDELEAIFREPHETLDVSVVRDNYQIRQQRTDVHWGAAAFTAQFVVETAAQLANTGIDTAVGIAVGILIEKLRERGYEVRHGKVRPLTAYEAEHYGLRAIEGYYGVPVADLTVRVSGKADDVHTVTAKGPDGSVYQVSFVPRGNEIQARAFQRTYPEAD